MPVAYDANDLKSHEVPALIALAARLSDCAQFIELSESADAAEAITKIAIGAFPDRIDNEEYTREELENDIFFCRISPETESGHEFAQPASQTECPNEGGRAEIYCRLQIREGELKQANGRQKAYLYFLDRVAASLHQLYEQVQISSDPGVRISKPGIRTDGPLFCDFASEVAQGCYLWCTYQVEWGDLDLGGGQ